MEQAITPATFAPSLRQLLQQIQSIAFRLEGVIATIENQAAEDRKFPGETDDKSMYRVGRIAGNRLSDLGKEVMAAMIFGGLSNEEIADRMDVAPEGVSRNRTRILRKRASA